MKINYIETLKEIEKSASNKNLVEYKYFIEDEWYQYLVRKVSWQNFWDSLYRFSLSFNATINLLYKLYYIRINRIIPQNENNIAPDTSNSALNDEEIVKQIPNNTIYFIIKELGIDADLIPYIDFNVSVNSFYQFKPNRYNNIYNNLRYYLEDKYYIEENIKVVDNILAKFIDKCKLCYAEYVEMNNLIKTVESINKDLEEAIKKDLYDNDLGDDDSDNRNVCLELSKIKFTYIMEKAIGLFDSTNDYLLLEEKDGLGELFSICKAYYKIYTNDNSNRVKDSNPILDKDNVQQPNISNEDKKNSVGNEKIRTNDNISTVSDYPECVKNVFKAPSKFIKNIVQKALESLKTGNKSSYGIALAVLDDFGLLNKRVVSKDYIKALISWGCIECNANDENEIEKFRNSASKKLKYPKPLKANYKDWEDGVDKTIAVLLQFS